MRRETGRSVKGQKGGGDVKISAIRGIRSRRAVLLGLLTSVLVGGHAVAEAAQPPPQAKAIRRPTMTAPTALRQIRERLKKGVRGNHGIFGNGCDTKYENVALTISRLSYTRVEDCENSRYESPPQSVALQFDNPSDWRRFDHLGDELGLSDPVGAIRYYSSGSDLADDAAPFAGFQEEARAWRALPVKPGLPDGVRRSQLLAEDAIRNKSFEEAINRYEQGLQALPLWPEGQFNAALLYGEIGIYGQAVLHMKRYLELRPDAPDAPSARDQVVIWQAKIR